ncbi:MAG TPA: hypothetical protein VFV50_12600 [Bdellovibrionales bacterium]|nr:hypothetical protein [Bdellovibrionales bacterium]
MIFLLFLLAANLFVTQASAQQCGRASRKIDASAELAKPGEQIVKSARWNVPMVIRGLGRLYPYKDVLKTPIIDDPVVYDVGIAGGGQTALVTALMLKGKKILMLEKQNFWGGLASGQVRGGLEYDPGTAYKSPPADFQIKILKMLGIDWERAAIHHPSDTLYIEGGLRLRDGTVEHIFPHFWEDLAVLRKLPATFEMIKFRMEKDEDAGVIGTQPIEQNKNMMLDRITMQQYIRDVPEWFARYVKENASDTEAAAMYRRFIEEVDGGFIERSNPMDLVLRHMVNYANSAEGANLDRIGAMTGANFQLSETGTRYTWQAGTGEVSKHIVKELQSRVDDKGQPLVKMIDQAEVISAEHKRDHVEIVYVKNGQRYRARARYAPMSMPIDTTLQVIKNLRDISPQHYQVMQDIRKEKLFTDYAVVVMFVKGHPAFSKITYDLWPVYKGPIDGRPTDFISGLWQQTEGYKHTPDSKYGIISAYVPLGPSMPRTQTELLRIAERAIDTMREFSDPIQKQAGEAPIEVEFAEINYWPSSILVPAPGHYTHRAPILNSPVGERIFINQSGIGAPSHEEAQYRGIQTAERILELEKRKKRSGRSRRK